MQFQTMNKIGTFELFEGLSQTTGEIYRRRKRFWNSLFKKYSKTRLNDIERPISSLNTVSSKIRHRVQGEYHPVQGECHQKENMSGVLSTTKNVRRSSSSSSVDTVAYILSNANTIDKARTVAIVEGAKNNTPEKRESDISTIEKEQWLNPVIEDTAQENINLKEDTVSSQINLNTNIENKMQLNKVNRNNNSICNYNLFYNTLLDDNSMNEIEINKKYNSDIKKSLISLSKTNFKKLDDTKSNLTKSNETEQKDLSKLSQRKKLYSGRDSPIDLIHTNVYNTDKQLKLKENLHPALHYEHTPLYRRMRKKRHTTGYFNLYLGLMDKTHDKALKRNSKKSSRRHKSTSSVFSRGLSILKMAKKNEKPLSYNKRLFEINKQSMTRKTENLNPVVYLTRLSELDIQKYMKSTNNTTKYGNLYPIVCAKKLLQRDISKYTKMNKKIHEIVANPVVRLQRLSELDMQRHTKIVVASNTETRSWNKEHNRQPAEHNIRSQDKSNRSDLINPIRLEDADSDESSLLIFNCTNKSNIEPVNSPSVSAECYEENVTDHSKTIKMKLRNKKEPSKNGVLHRGLKAMENVGTKSVMTTRSSNITLKKGHNDTLPPNNSKRCKRIVPTFDTSDEEEQFPDFMESLKSRKHRLKSSKTKLSMEKQNTWQGNVTIHSIGGLHTGTNKAALPWNEKEMVRLMCTPGGSDSDSSTPSQRHKKRASVTAKKPYIFRKETSSDSDVNSNNT